MRSIVKRRPPAALVAWRQRRLANHQRPEVEREGGLECDYRALSADAAVREAVEESLFCEQGGLCAYTGMKLELRTADAAAGHPREVGFHLEHLKAQTHCRSGPTAQYGEDTDYSNLVACWPQPDDESPAVQDNPQARRRAYQVRYGAVHKASWPTPGEAHLFVSPLRGDCEVRFTFDRRGRIVAARPNDEAAQTTIERLGLNHDDLVELRYGAMMAVLQPKPGTWLRLEQARRKLETLRRQAQDLDRGVPIELAPFCFAIEHALAREIKKQEGILASKKQAAAAKR